MPASTTPIETRFTAWMDNPNDPTIPNAIHSADGAKEYGFQAALVGGVTVYGWCIPTILKAAGESWLDTGWIDVHFRRPTYPGDELTVTANPSGDDLWTLTANKAGDETCIRGEFGLGEAPWLNILELSSHRDADPPLDQRERLTLENAPIGKDLRTMPVLITADEIRAHARDAMRTADPLFAGEHPVVHPFFPIRHMMNLLSYSYDYGRPSIHASSHVQNYARIPAGEDLILTGHFVAAYEQRGHHYAVFDGNLLSATDGREFTRIRHTNIFKIAPRDSA
jgi:hypothetical protein